jgi:translation initiation factor IF-3
MIRIPEVRVIDSEGEQIGVMKTKEALDLAYSKGLDLVEISPTARPPVCKILDFGRYKYELQKKEKEKRKKSQSVAMKEMQYRPKIEEHDYQFKTRHVIDFLKGGHKVKLMVRFRGREMAHQEFGRKILDQLTEELSEIATVEVQPKMEGNTMSMVMNPRPEVRKGGEEKGSNAKQPDEKTS